MEHAKHSFGSGALTVAIFHFRRASCESRDDCGLRLRIGFAGQKVLGRFQETL
jgi:hypothetical protein